MKIKFVLIKRGKPGLQQCLHKNILDKCLITLSIQQRAVFLQKGKCNFKLHQRRQAFQIKDSDELEQV